MPAWILARPLLSLAMLAAIIFAAWALWWTITSRPKAEARLSRNQAQAAAQSGADAVNTVGRAGDREAASDALTRSNEGMIRNAEGGDAKVAAPVNDAGLAALCRRASHRDSPRCVGMRERGANSR